VSYLRVIYSYNPVMSSTLEQLTLPTLYYDGACPVCSREIAMYRRQAGAELIEWVDAAHCTSADLGPGLTREAALAKLHMRAPSGELIAGAAAFAGLWQTLPRFAWLGRAFGAGFLLRCFDFAYVVVLKLRPLWRKKPRVN
jgi:predicted DCC family thiol-disulfide oxidoreductase YuxK